MSDDLLYNLVITIEHGADISDVEGELERLLFDLYDVETVEAIKVKDRTPPIDEDMDKLLEVIDDLESSDVHSAIDLVNELGNLDNE